MAVSPTALTPARFTMRSLFFASRTTSRPAATVARSSMNASDSCPVTTNANAPSIARLLPLEPCFTMFSVRVSVSAWSDTSRAAVTAVRSSMYERAELLGKKPLK